MDDRIRDLFALNNNGKRIYQVKEGEVTRADFEYCAILTNIIFGRRGLVETLGSTWQMVHDPRFEELERQFIIEKKSKFGGDARQGVQQQTSDGTFTGSFAGIEQYTELLGEGRFLLDLLRSHALVEAVATRYPERSFHLEPKNPHRGLALLAPYTKGIRQKLWDGADEQYKFGGELRETDTDEFLYVNFMESNPAAAFEALGVLTPFEKSEVQHEADQLAKYEPHHFKDWADDDIWAIIREEYHNYFTRKGLPNQIAKTLFKLIKADAVGLITDYAEIANINETVLLDDPNILYEPEKHGTGVGHVFAEIEILERALSYRAELRVTAARLLQHLGLADRVSTTELTDHERDELLKMVYRFKWPDEQTELVIGVLSFLSAITLTGKSRFERETEQLDAASLAAQATMAAMKAGEILPISRDTEETVDVVASEGTEEDQRMEAIFNNPIALFVFLRLTNIEDRLRLLLTPIVAEMDLTPAKAAAQMEQYVELFETPGYIERVKPDVLPEDLADFEAMEKLARAAQVLTPIFQNKTFVWTDEATAELLDKVEEIDPTPEPVVEQHEGVYGNRVDEPSETDTPVVAVDDPKSE